MTARPLDGLKAFVVEDEALISMMIEGMLETLGATIEARASRLADAEATASSVEADFALLDLNLQGALSFPVADALTARGVPFLFSTGYGGANLPERFAAATTIGKPFQEPELARAVLAAIRTRT